MGSEKLLFGVDVYLQQADKLKNLRLALVTNDAATTSTGIPSRIALQNSKFYLTKLFSPEHGLTAQGKDGAFQTNIKDRITGLPVVSLYGDRLRPLEKDIADVDAVLFDIPDAGCRFYTYLWTMTYVMEACAEFNKPLFILDRPNPISGDLNLAEGTLLDEANCSSFIGRWSIPVRHSCTLGELANYFAATRISNLNLQIIKVQNWDRGKTVQQKEWFFVSPSPAIIDGEAALFYPGVGLLEGVNVNEGRGTDHPFKILGAPWINAVQIHKAFQHLTLPGIIAQPYSYKPHSGLYADENCHGLRLNVTDISAFCPMYTGLQIIQLILSLYPGYCKERLYKTVANPSGKKHLDRLTGVYNSFEKIKNNNTLDFNLDVAKWKEIISAYLLY
jgi:uncharacterized protein YbbC (DUF1343 family)